MVARHRRERGGEAGARSGEEERAGAEARQRARSGGHLPPTRSGGARACGGRDLGAVGPRRAP
eukprot:11185812-Lingulodinium_polyedra.AAC.1